MVGDVFEQDARVLRLHLGEAVFVGFRDRLEVASEVGGVDLRRGRPLLEIAENLGGFVVECALHAVGAATSLEVDDAVSVCEPAREPLHLCQRPVGLFVVALWAERVHVAVHAVVAQGHSGGGAGLRRHDPTLPQRCDMYALVGAGPMPNQHRRRVRGCLVLVVDGVEAIDA